MFMHPGNTVLSAHHDGELSPSAGANVEEHLTQCDACLFEYEQLSTAANAVRHLGQLRAPSGFSAMVREQIDAEERGMVPVLRAQILRSRAQGGFFSALGLGTLATVLLIGMVVTADYRYGEQAARRITSAWIQSTLPEPELLYDSTNAPRFREGSFVALPFPVVQILQNGHEGSALTMASIDVDGSVQVLEVIHESGDVATLAYAMAAVREAGFERASLGDQGTPLQFLVYFTSTEVRPDDVRLSRLPIWQRIEHARQMQTRA